MISREESQSRLDQLAAGALKHTPEQHYTVADRLEERAELSPHTPALIWNNEAISWGQLNKQANRYAHYFLSHDIKQGDAVALMMENRPDFLYIWMGLAKIGAVAALINTHVSGAALQHAIRTTSSRLMLVGDECLDKLPATDDQRDNPHPIAIETYRIPGDLAARDSLNDLTATNIGVLAEQLSSYPDGNPDNHYRDGLIGESLFCLVFTSGTTGLPKAAKVTHMRWLATGEGWLTALSLDESDVFYCVLPLYHVAAGMSLLSQSFASGGAFLLRPRFSASRFWDDVRQHNVTVTQYSGEMCRYLINQPPKENDRDHSLRVMAGAGLSAEVWPRFQQRFGVERLIEGYGGTETNVNLVNLDSKHGACGRIPYKDRHNARLVKYDIENDDYIHGLEGQLMECEPGQVGELLGMIINMPGVGGGRFSGYTDAAATEKKILRDVFQPGDAWYRTGDLLVRDDEDYYYFVDRIGDTYRWKSENVSTSEVSNVLQAYAGLELITVYGVTVPDHEGRAGMAAIVMQDEQLFDPEAFYQLAQLLPRYAMPVFVRVKQQADITSTFKLRKVDLQKQGYDLNATDDEFYVLDPEHNRYSPLTSETLTRLGIPECQANH